MNNEINIATANIKYIRISSFKLEKILSQIRGKLYKDAINILKYMPQKNSFVIWKALYSAVSNGQHLFNVKKDNFVVYQAYVNKGSILKRVRPRAKGKAFQIQKKISHLTIKVKKI